MPSCKLRHELNVKGKSQKENCPGVVYGDPCADCLYVYIRETEKLKQHMSQSTLAVYCDTASHATN